MKEFYAANQEQGEEGLADQVILLNWGLILVLVVWIAAPVAAVAVMAIAAPVVMIVVVWIAAPVAMVVVLAVAIAVPVVVLVVVVEAPERALVPVSGQHFLGRERTSELFHTGHPGAF